MPSTMPGKTRGREAVKSSIHLAFSRRRMTIQARMKVKVAVTVELAVATRVLFQRPLMVSNRFHTDQ